MWLNFLFLMAVAFLPFATSLLGEYSREQASVVIYAANAAVTSLLLVAISWYATSGHRLVAPDMDIEAEEEVRCAIASLRDLLDRLWKQLRSIEGSGPHSGYARLRTAEQIRRVHRDLVALYGVVFPETDGEKIIDKRLAAMMDQPLPEGFPEMGEQAAVQAAVDKYVEELEGEYMSVGWQEIIADSYEDR